MLTIRTLTGTTFDLTPGTKLSIEETSVMFSDAGSYSLPLSLPPTENNLRILEHPHRPDRRKQFITSLDVTVSCGVWVRRARMDIESAGKNQDITTSLFFRESPLYAAIRDRKLADLFVDEIRDDFRNISLLRDRIFAWIDYLNGVMRSQTVDDFYLFPVLAKFVDVERVTEDGAVRRTERFTRFAILNQVNWLNGAHPPLFPLHLTGRPHTEDGSFVNMLMGYGVCPFLKFTYVLRTMFAKLGYTLTQSEFDTDAGFQKLCFIHNTIDCLCRGFLDYSQLLPDVSITDFLSFVENSFGCRFIVSEIDKSVTPRFWKDVITAQSGKDISQTFEDYPLTTFTAPHSLKLTVNRASADAAPIEFDNFRALLQKYGSFKGSYKNMAALEDILPKSAPPMFNQPPYSTLEGVYYLQDIRHYASVRIVQQFAQGVPANLFTGFVDVIEKDTLDLFDTDNRSGEFEDRPLGINAITFRYVPLNGITAFRTSFEVDVNRVPFGLGQHLQDVLNNHADSFIPNDGPIALMPFIDSLRHLNTVQQTTVTVGEESTTDTKEERDSDCPIMLCFSHGQAVSSDDWRIGWTLFGSPDAYDNAGNRRGTFDLSTRSLYEYFWKEYDALLRTSFHDISGAAHFSLSDVMKLRFDVPVSFQGQKLLPESIRYELSDDGVEVVEFRAKTIKEYE